MSSVPTPGGGGCPIVLGAALLGLLAVYLMVHVVIWAVAS